MKVGFWVTNSWIKGVLVPFSNSDVFSYCIPKRYPWRIQESSASLSTTIVEFRLSEKKKLEIIQNSNC